MSENIHATDFTFNHRKLWRWLGDREVFFCEKKGDITTNSCDMMLTMFNILYTTQGMCFWQLKNNPEKQGLVDVMGSFMDSHVSYTGPGMLSYFCTHDEDGEEIDCIEPHGDVHESWFKENKLKPELRNMLTK